MGNKIAVIGDLHLAPKCENATIREHVVSGQKAFLASLAERLHADGIKKAIFAGDIFTNRQMLSVEALDYALTFFGTDMAGIDVYMIGGNHDMMYENSNSVCSIRALGLLPNVTVHTDDTGVLKLGGRTWYLVPWVTPDRSLQVETWLGKLARKDPGKTVIIGHFDMRGALMEAKQVSECGFEPSVFHSASNYVFSGHYHCPSTMQKGDSSIRYVGSPYQLSFAHVDTTCGYYLVDEDTMECEYVENTVSPRFAECVDDRLDDLPDYSNMFVRYYMRNDRPYDDTVRRKLILEGHNPICIKAIPYGDNDGTVDDARVADDEESRRIMETDSIGMAEMYMDKYPELLPTLSSGADPKTMVLKFLHEYDSKAK